MEGGGVNEYGGGWIRTIGSSVAVGWSRVASVGCGGLRITSPCQDVGHAVCPVKIGMVT